VTKFLNQPSPVNKSCRLHLSSGRIEKLMAVAASRRPAEKIIRNVNLVNVHLPRIEEDVSLALAQGRIAAVGKDLDRLAGPKTEIIDGRDRLVLPGLIDAHTHLDSIFSVREFAALALLSGHTTAVSETAMIANAAGRAGVEAFMAEASDLPFRVFFLAPPLVPPFPRLETSAGLDLADFKRILKRRDVLGVGETYWRPALDLEPRTTRRFAAAQALGKTLEGHAAGARNLNLQAYRAGGVSSCHEATTPEEVMERLALGLTVLIREGYIRSELPAMAPLARRRDLDTRRLVLVTDLASPEMLLHSGVMIELVRRAAAVGFDPLQAVQMATLNPADYFGLTALGRLDPGALADLVLVDDLKTLKVETVLADGRVVAHQGLLTVALPEPAYPPDLYRSFQLDKVDPKDFRLTAPPGTTKARAVAVASETITREALVDIKASRGRVAADPERDLVKIAVFNKHESRPTGRIGLAAGLGLKAGAVAASLLWDTNNILCAGVTDREMALAVNRLLELRGGLVVVRGQRVLAEMPLPVGGVISDKPLSDIFREWAAVEEAIHALGSRLSRPFLTFQTFCFTGLPFLRLTDKGLVDVRQGRLVDIFL